MSARTPLAVIAVALALAALAVPADGSLPRAEPLVYGGRVLCPFPRHPERCRGPRYNGALYVGYFGTGHSLTVTNEGAVFTRGGQVGGPFATADRNYALVTGSGSIWSNDMTTTMTVGQNGHYNLVAVQSGGRFDTGTLPQRRREFRDIFGTDFLQD